MSPFYLSFQSPAFLDKKLSDRDCRIFFESNDRGMDSRFRGNDIRRRKGLPRFLRKLAMTKKEKVKGRHKVYPY